MFNVTGTWKTHFSQYADEPLVEKEIIFLHQPNLNNTSSSSNNDNQAKESHDKLSSAKNSSDTNHTGQEARRMRSISSASDTDANKNESSQDKLNQNNSSQEECTGSGSNTATNSLEDHPLKEELDSAAKSGTEEHVHEMENTGKDEKKNEAKINTELKKL